MLEAVACPEHAADLDPARRQRELDKDEEASSDAGKGKAAKDGIEVLMSDNVTKLLDIFAPAQSGAAGELLGSVSGPRQPPTNNPILINTPTWPAPSMTPSSHVH